MVVLNQVLPYTLPFVIGILGLLATRAVNRQAAITAQLENQREDFKTVLEPIQAELSTYRESYTELKNKVDHLEDRLDLEIADKRILVRTVGDQQDHISRHMPGDPFHLPRRVVTLLSEDAT